MDEILGVIPARGGSKGIKRKNLHLLAGKPLIQYTIEVARKCRNLSRVVVSTEDPEIAELAGHMELEVITRPDDLALDDTPMVPRVDISQRSLWSYNPPRPYAGLNISMIAWN
jgi:CMP-N,N'-diacetyllegionaminic acid synthase